MGIPGINQISFDRGEPISAKKVSEEAVAALKKSDKQMPDEFKNVEKENPISKRGEFWKLLPSTFVCGTCGFLKLIATMVENDSGFLGDLFDLIGEKTKDKIKDKKNNGKTSERMQVSCGTALTFRSGIRRNYSSNRNCVHSVTTKARKMPSRKAGTWTFT